MMRRAHARCGALAGTLLVAASLWRLALAVQALPEELSALAPGRLAAGLGTPLAERIRSALSRREHEFATLALLTPAEARILVPRPEQGGTWQDLRMLCFPRRFEYCEPGPDWRVEPETYILKPATLVFPTEGLRLVERRGGFELWLAERSDGGR